MAQYKKRNYEVSIWTLQDEFITVLKPSNVENKGQISKGKTIIKDDGTLELSFSIPMYYYENKKRIENPIWYTTRNGMIVQDMRKIKLIFNKDTDVVQVFEFLIIDVKENHNSDILTCDINTEGMIFNELGKWGYKVSLSSEEFYARDYDFFTNKEWKDNNGIVHKEQPRGTLQYWLNHFLIPLPTNTSNLDITKWYYKIEMDWSSYGPERDNDKVYEDEYTGSWEDTGSGYIPKEIVEAKEKERMVDLEESNAYNLTQNLAETFGIFCRYEYLYDSNYRIIGRVAIFYNNYIKENEGYLDLTYPYSTSAITRQRDSKDVTTKMFVRPVADDTSSSGLITILDVAANKSKEDYLFNFDYLRTVNGVTEEQYIEIDKYEYEIGKCNTLLKKLEGPLIALRNRLPELEAAVTLHTNAIQLDKERISASNDLLNNLDKKDENADGTIEITKTAPRTAILKQSSNTDNSGAYYIDLTDHGVVLQTLHIYRKYNFVNKEPDYSTELKTGTPEYDEFGNIIKINNLFINDSALRTVYLVYNYIPKLYYERVLKTWQSRLGTDEAALTKTKNELVNAQNRINNLQSQYDETLTQKRKLVANFDKMMGPALRESYWQPDNYTDYGDNYIDTFPFSSNATVKSSGSSGYTELFWDTKLFDDEQKTTYEYSAAQTTQFYPCIKLGSKLDYIKEHINELSFMFYDYIAAYPTGNDVHNIRNFPVGSLCQYGFIKEGNNVEPVLILTGTENMSTTQINEMKLSSHSPKIGVLTTNVTSSGINTVISSSFDVESAMWVTSAMPVYPRIKIGSLALKTSTDMIGLTYEDTELKNYEDYYILMRDDSIVNTEGTVITSDAAYYVTIEPKAMLQKGSITAAVKFKFNLSNADTAIYLDAIQVLKENAYPRVSYTIDPSVIDEDFLYTLYNKLNCICNINDTDLKLENVQGYISKLELDLDKPENDHIEIKNYKTKFEDLFTSIVAQTEAMKKSAYTIGLAAQAFTSTGDINADVLQNSVMKVDLNYAFNNGKLTIDEKNGIWGVSDSGVVAFRGGGIFTATEKDSTGNWKWNTGIVPQGINANLISTGQLDTNRINIFAGDRVRFQLNGEGLFAYKSFFEDFNINSLSPEALGKIDNSSNRMDDLDVAQYVVMNQNGLFLVGESGALVLNRDKTDYIKLNKTVKRVEVSWEGFKLRNWNDLQVFWADPDSGNLYVSGTIFANEFGILDDRTDIGKKLPLSLNEYLKIKFEDNVKVSESLDNIFEEAGEIISWAGSTLNDLTDLSIQNGNVLNKFLEQAKALRPKTYTSATPPTTGFKPGDLWIPESGTYKGNKYMAMSFSDNSNDPNISNPLAGWNRTYDGSLASITGAGIDIDAVAGTINMYAGSKISIKAKSYLDLAAADIQITGNNSINIGANKINIGANSGINIVASNIDTDTETDSNGDIIGAISRVSISTTGILMHGSKIELMVGDSGSVAALALNPTDGIYIGSNKVIRLFSGNIDGNGGNVLLSPSKILFGVNSTGTATAVEMTKEYVVLASAEQLTNVENATASSWTASNATVSGVKITKDGIWLATGASSTRSLISMIPGSIVIGVAAQDGTNNGNFIELSQTQMKIGSSTDIYIKATNIELTTINGRNGSLVGFRLGLEDKPSLTLKGYDLYIAGTIYANEFYVLNNRDDKNPILLEDFLNIKIDDHVKVSESLEEIFNEVGDLLEQASSTLNGLDSTAATNHAILQGFLNKAKNLNPVISQGENHPVTFKPGDIWEPASGVYAGHKYIAVAFSDKTNSNDPLSGWNRTYDGSLASITGAGINIDAVAGTIDMYAGSRIRLKSKSYLELSSGDIQITGNNSINIGSKWINIGSTSGINIVNTIITNSTTTESNGKVGTTSRVTIDTNGIIMHSSYIELMAAESDNIAALSLNPNTGIYIGSGRAINLYSGNVNSSANVTLSPTKILFGVSNTSSSTTAVEMTESYIIMASGNNINSLRSTSVPTISNNLTGVKITKDGFYVATGSGDTRNLIQMDATGIVIGNNSSGSGNFISLTQDSMSIGSSTNIYINANNIGLDTTKGGTGVGFRLGSAGSPKLEFKNNSLYIAGTIYANEFYVLDSRWDTDGAVLLDKYIEDHVNVGATLDELFTEAGTILSEASTTLNNLDNLALTNAETLKGFLEQAKNLQPVTYTSSTRPTNFKPGDIWIPGDSGNKYIATSFPGNTSGSLYSGWNKTYDGSFASINGAYMNIDTTTGSITLKAKSYLDLSSGSIQITGNNDVNIGGGTVNIGSNSAINIINSYIQSGTSDTDINNASSAILINSSGISLTASKIELKAYRIVNDTLTSAAVLELDPYSGIFIGSNNSINLFTTDIASASSASVSLSPTRIMFGVANEGTSSTAVEMTENYVIMAAGTNIATLRTEEPTYDNNLTGVKITKDGFFVATGTDTSRSILRMGANGIMLGNLGDSEGGYIYMTKGLILLGSSTRLYINAENIALDTTYNGTGIGFRLGSSNDPKLIFKDGNLSITGTIYATGLYIGDSQQTLDQYVSGMAGGSRTYYQSARPAATENYKKGDLWYDIDLNRVYVAKANYTTAQPDQWVDFIKVMSGTYFSINAEAGTIIIRAESNFIISSDGAFNLICAGEMGISGSGTIYINSGMNIYTFAQRDIAIHGGGKLDFYGGTITMSVSEYSDPSVKIDSSGIALNGENISLTATGNISLEGTSGIINFGTDPSNPAFSVDNSGVVMCSKIICKGDIIGTIPHSGSGTSGDPYILYLNESNTQQAYGYYSHTRQTEFKCQNVISPGNYVCNLDWSLTCIGNTLNSTKITVYYLRPDNVRVMVYQDNSVGTWYSKGSERISGGNNAIISIDNYVQILNFETVVSYSNNSGTCGSRYSQSYNNTVKLIPQ